MSSQFTEKVEMKDGKSMIISAMGDSQLVSGFARRELERINRFHADSLGSFKEIYFRLENTEEEKKDE